MIEVKLKLFGIFRDLNENNMISFNLWSPIKIIEFKKIVCDYFLKLEDSERYDASLDSVFAWNNKIVLDDFIIEKNLELAIIPPVCGG